MAAALHFKVQRGSPYSTTSGTTAECAATMGLPATIAVGGRLLLSREAGRRRVELRSTEVYGVSAATYNSSFIMAVRTSVIVTIRPI